MISSATGLNIIYDSFIYLSHIFFSWTLNSCILHDIFPNLFSSLSSLLLENTATPSIQVIAQIHNFEVSLNSFFTLMPYFYLWNKC